MLVKAATVLFYFLLKALTRHAALCCAVQIPPFGEKYKCTGVCAAQVYDKMVKTAAGEGFQSLPAGFLRVTIAPKEGFCMRAATQPC